MGKNDVGCASLFSFKSSSFAATVAGCFVDDVAVGSVNM